MPQVPLSVALTARPMTPLDLTITLQQGLLSSLPRDQFVSVLLRTRECAQRLKAEARVARVALISAGGNSIRLLPLKGLGPDWKPIPNRLVEFHTKYPGYVSSRNGPKMEDKDLDNLLSKFACAPAKDARNLSFHGESSDNNLFAKIVRGELPSWRIWESDTHVAFLTPFANVPGFTVLVPRSHLVSEIFAIDTKPYADLVGAAHDVMQEIKKAFGISRVGICFEGLEIDYAHVKLIPLFEDKDSVAARTGVDLDIEAPDGGWKDGLYPGSVSTHVGSNEIDTTIDDGKLGWLQV